jgi:peptide/nickel transport system ATP-binding protein
VRQGHRDDLPGADVSLNPVFTVGFQIGEVLRQHLGMNKRQARARTLELLDEVGIPDPAGKIDAYPSQMSGGQQQRVMIAMAIACEPRLLIADEPTTALDVTIQKQIMELIARLQKKHQMSVLFITHDLGLVGEIADRVIVMRHGEVREEGRCAQVLHAPPMPIRGAAALPAALDERPVRLPVIDDVPERAVFRRAACCRSVRAAMRAFDDNVLVVSGLQQELLSARRPVRQARVQGREGRVVHAPARQDPGRGGRIRLRQDHGRPDPAAPAPRHRRQRHVRRPRPAGMSDREYQAYKRRIQIIFQNPYASLNPRFTVGQILLEPMRIHRIGANDAERIEHAHYLLKRVGLPEQAFHRYPHEFSGGQRQRIAIARCLTMKPEILVCDESVSALDVSVQAQVLNLLQDLQDEYG